MNPFDSKNPDIRFSLSGEIEEYKKQGILDLNFYPTNSKHAKEHGIDAKNPLYLQNLIVKESDRLKFIGKKVLLYLDEYAKQNGNDVIFGYVNQTATMTKDNRTGYFTEFTDVDWIKHWLFRNGYCVKRETNNFYKVLEKKDKYYHYKYSNGLQFVSRASLTLLTMVFTKRNVEIPKLIGVWRFKEFKQ